MRIAYVQDWLTVDGGAEKVTKEILSLYPTADVYSLIDFLSIEDRNHLLSGKKAHTSFIQQLPYAKKLYRWYLPLFPYAIEQFDLSQYDLVISSSYSVAKGVLTHAHQRHICYCHSPMRYAWDLHHQYLKGKKSGRRTGNLFMRYFLSKIRIWDVISSNRVDHFLANSVNVQERIAKIYRRESTVIHPPVDVGKFKLNTERSDYYITASRLVEYKRVDLIVEAFKILPDKKLIVLGSGPELSALKKLAAGHLNIEIRGQVSDEALKSAIKNAKAFIIAAHEDFGIAPIEAQACGTPIIGFGKGGILETTIEGKTAIYFDEQRKEVIVEAIHKFEASKLAEPAQIRQSIEKFDISVFREKFQAEVNKCLNT